MKWKRETLRAVNAAAALAGLHAVPIWRRRTEPFSEHLARLFRCLGVTCVLDVGANEGQYRDFLRNEVDFSGWIVSYEPIPELAQRLKERAKRDRRWIVHAKALGPDEAARTFSVMANREFSSFLEPDASTCGALERQNTVERQLTVPTTTLGRAMEAATATIGASNFYLKLDTQGFDLTILQAGRDEMAHLLGLQTEASVKPLYRQAPRFTEAFAWLDEMGFDLSGMFPNNEGHFPILVEFDAVFVNRRHLSRSPRLPTGV